MKDSFYWAMILFIPGALLLWMVAALAKTLWEMFQDWQLRREIDEMQESAGQRQQQRAAANVARLNNGCAHDFETSAHGLPPLTCHKCGLEKERPPGTCDHVWRVQAGAVPRSVCEKCGRKYSVTGQLA
jgi:hypothetical protein